MIIMQICALKYFLLTNILELNVDAWLLHSEGSLTLVPRPLKEFRYMYVIIRRMPDRFYMAINGTFIVKTIFFVEADTLSNTFPEGLVLL